MSWLTPLGFLGLTGLIALIIIYIIKPNYQNKIISSTFVWKLSLKYKKNKIPLSKLRNILLLLCQILIIIITSFMLAQPYFAEEEEKTTSKKVFIIDASASMMAKVGLDETRFDRALLAIEEEVESTLKLEDSEVSIILAHDNADFLVQQATAFTKGDITEALTKLKEAAANNQACTYGDADIEGAMKKAEKLTAFTPDVEVILYTDTNYTDAGNVTVKNVNGDLDFNVAVLDARMTKFDNRYTLEVDVVCYGQNRNVTVYAIVEGKKNTEDEYEDELDGIIDGLTPTSFEISVSENLRDGEITTLYIPGFSKDDFSTEAEYSETYESECPYLFETVSYSTVTARVEEDDAFSIDDTFNLVGGEKLPLNILYVSDNPNNYFSTAFRIIREKLKYRWDIQFKEFIVIPDMKDQVIPTEGYDIYIYERFMPEILPEDGISILSDPLYDINGAGFKLGSEKYLKELTYFSKEEDHPIIKNLTPDEIGITKYTEIMNPDASYLPLLYCGMEPVVYATDRSELGSKVVLMPFSLNYSNLPIVIDFPLMMYNILEYYMPSTITNYIYDVNQSVQLNSRGEDLTVVTPDGITKVLTVFPENLTVTVPGMYSVTQYDLNGDPVTELFYVKIPDSESNIVATVDVLENPQFMVVPENEEIINTDILLYFAIALVTLLFAEWWLHTREQY